MIAPTIASMTTRSVAAMVLRSQSSDGSIFGVGLDDAVVAVFVTIVVGARASTGGGA